MLGHLEPRADPVRQRDAIGRGGAERVQHQLSDRGRRQLAVAQQVVEGLIPSHRLIPAVGLDEPSEGALGEIECPRLDGQRLHRRMLGVLARVHPIELALGPIEQSVAVAQDLVADVVDQAGDAVDRQQRLPPPAAEQGDRHREVLLSGLGHHRVMRGNGPRARCLLGVLPRLEARHASRPARRHRRHLPSAITGNTSR